MGKWSEKASAELKRFAWTKNKLSACGRFSSSGGSEAGKIGIICFLDIFILDYIYNSEMALPGHAPSSSTHLLGSRQAANFLSSCLVFRTFKTWETKLLTEKDDSLIWRFCRVQLSYFCMLSQCNNHINSRPCFMMMPWMNLVTSEKSDVN